LLHHIGSFLTYNGYQRHGHYLVRNAELLGFDQLEIVMMAELVLYHRGALPRVTHHEFAMLEPEQRTAVRTLSTFLRIAENLDRSQTNHITSARLGVEKPRRIVLELQASRDPQVEISGLENQRGAIERVFGRKLVVRTWPDDAAQSIEQAQAPFAGRFKPEEPLLLLREHLAEGVWSLRVEDMAAEDGGVLESFRLQLFTKQAQTSVASNFNIQLRFTGGLSASQRSVFELAKARWQEIITGDLPSVDIDGEEIDDLLIEASGESIDGAGRVLGQAGPTHVRTDSQLPCKGIMAFDVADLADMEANGSLVDVIIHEMGHVIGLGTIWHDKGLVVGANTNNPEFTGVQSKSVYASLRGESQPKNVPLENEGGAGTAEGHWREVTFDNELMTGFIDPGENPLSRLTIAALQDLGYQVNPSLADGYSLPAPGMSLFRLRSAARRFKCPVKPAHPKRVPPK
jgi:hypothetical protein